MSKKLNYLLRQDYISRISQNITTFKGYDWELVFNVFNKNYDKWELSKYEPITGKTFAEVIKNAYDLIYNLKKGLI
jgi:hypothetical protein